MLGYQTVSG